MSEEKTFPRKRYYYLDDPLRTIYKLEVGGDNYGD